MAIVTYFFNFTRCAILLAALLLAAFAKADPLPLWELETDNGRVFMMGSVHFLRASDYPLPAGLEAAYQLADTLVMEVDMDDLDPMQAQTILTDIGTNPNGAGLSSVIGASAYAEASGLAQELGVPLMLFDQFKPWFAALSITQLRMMQLGFDPNWGIETQLTAKARGDGKPVLGLETLEQQLGFLDKLDDETQKVFLLQSLQDATELENEVSTIMTAWRSGNSAALEELLIEGLQEAPRLFDSILVQRNRNWVPQIIDLSRQPGDVLIIVGAMHLVGDDSVLEMLADRGIQSRQLSNSDLD
jgi:uncharacterized protein YbaP (TraB family)